MTALPLRALLVSNGIEGLDRLFRPSDLIHYDTVVVGPDFVLDLDSYDVLIAPNGTDHVALFKARHAIARFLERGGTLMCFDGWFTDWIPGHRWVMDNSRRTIDMRYRIRDDRYGIAPQFDVEALNFSHGISGWWSCGYIEPHPAASVLLEDTWQRPLLVIDRDSTPGTIVLTASGPLGDISYGTTDDSASDRAMGDLYRALVSFVHSQKIPVL